MKLHVLEMLITNKISLYYSFTLHRRHTDEQNQM